MKLPICLNSTLVNLPQKSEFSVFSSSIHVLRFDSELTQRANKPAETAFIIVGCEESVQI
jgi:hypothetical protein